MFGLGGGELLLIFFLALIFIGPKKLPELAKSLGKSIREFQKAKDELIHQVNTPEVKEPQNVAHQESKTEIIVEPVTPEVSQSSKDSDKPV